MSMLKASWAKTFLKENTNMRPLSIDCLIHSLKTAFERQIEGNVVLRQPSLLYSST